jgi:hypothetical protein
VYDMYHWDQPDAAAGSGTERPARRADAAQHPSRRIDATDRPRHQADGDRGAGRAGRAGLHARPASAARAVQVALDRRDNGGDPRAPGDK